MASTKLLEEALKLPVEERIRVAELLLASADSDESEPETDDTEDWAGELEVRSRATGRIGSRFEP